jgi:hypothetical protein
MRSGTEVAWRKRLLDGLASLVLTLSLTIGLMAIRDFHRDPTLTWFNGGEITVIAHFVFVGGYLLLPTYFFFVAPIVLLWPAASQRKHWYALLCAAMFGPLLADMIFWRIGLFVLLEKMRDNPGLYCGFEAFALCSCGLYLALLRWQHRRLAQYPSHP